MTVKQKATKWLAHFALAVTLVMGTVTTGSAEAVGGAGAKAIKKGAKVLKKGAKGIKGNKTEQIRKAPKGSGRKSSVWNKTDKWDIEEKRKKKIRRLVFKGWVIVTFVDGQNLCPKNMEEARCFVLTPEEECLVLQARDQKRKREGRGSKTRPPEKCRKYLGGQSTLPITITSPTTTLWRDKLRRPRSTLTATVIPPVRE